MSLTLRPAADCRFDLVSLGEVMLRLDPGDGPHPHHALASRSGRAAASTTSPAACKRCFGLRHRRRHRPRRQPGRPPGRGPHLPGRRRPVARPLGAGRRRRPHRAQRPQLHRARLRRARGRRLLRPRPHRGLAAQAGRHRLGRASSARRARAGSTPAASSPRSPRRRPLVAKEAMEAAQQARHDRLLRPQLPRLALEVDRRPEARAGGQPRARAPTST